MIKKGPGGKAVAHAEEQHRLELRVSQLEQLALASTVAEAARDCASAARDCTVSAEAARTAIELLASDTLIEELISQHCKNAAFAVKTTIQEAAASAAVSTSAEVKRSLQGRKK